MHWLSPLRLGVLSLFLFLTACGGGGGDSAPAVVQPQPDPASWLQGSAVNSALVGAEIKLFRFDTDGTEVEIVAGSAPVLTDADGDYKFWITGGSIDASTGPLILRSVGGTMNSAAAPKLEAVLADSSGLQADGATLTQHLSLGSSVAASLLRLQATQAAAAPSAADAAGIISLVEQQLAIGLDQDPSDPTQPLAIYAQSVDENLGLSQTPDNAPAVNEFIDYLALNLNSDSGQLDNTMQDPATGLMVPASFNNIGSGLLASLVPQGPASFQTVKISLDKREIENDGMDTAFLTASLVDGTGAPVADGTVVMYENTAGRVVMSRNRSSTVDGSSRINITSVWPGAAQVTVLYEGADQALHSAVVEMNIVNNVADVVDTIPPKVSSAGATSNTEILVSFSEAMRGGIEGAENPAHYRVSAVNSLLTPKTGAAKATSGEKSGSGDQDNQKPEVRIIGAELILPDRKTVRLTTLSQSDLLYAVRVVNLSDVNGNGMSAGEQFDSDPTRAEFEGVPPSGAEVVDTDGDGLSDSDEQRGWIVTTVTAAGVVLTFEVTSDPLNPDTDGDGVTDNEEFHGALNPRTADSDGDTLTDDQEWNTIFSDGLNQDTDGDGVQDGFEYYTFRTSPILADTDGDQISDPDEVAAGNRNPLVADLPSPRISVGNLSLQLNTKFSITNESGQVREETKTNESTLSRGTEDAQSSSSENSTKNTLEFSEELKLTKNFGISAGVASATIEGTFGSKQGSERGSTFTAGQESARSSEEEYHDSLTISATRDVRESVNRDIESASIKAFVSIDNLGDVPFTISNLELTAQTQDPNNRRRVIPVASLVPENESLGSVNLGALGDTSRGPFVFATSQESVFPQQVQELMKNPRGLVVQIANFDITDELGRNFSFTSRDVLDRTAGITFDMGDGRTETYRVATASAHDRATGRPLGIPMSYALEVIGLQRYAYVRDGGNGILETAAAGDDDSGDKSPGSWVESGSIAITAGENGLLEAVVAGDDVLMEPDYATALKEDKATIRDSGNRRSETIAAGDDVQLAPLGTMVAPDQVLIHAGPDGVLQTAPAGDDRVVAPSRPYRVLSRFRDTRVDPGIDSFWVLFRSSRGGAVDLDDMVIRAGENYDFAYVQDQDADGVWASEEYLHGSSDLMVNTDGCAGPLTDRTSADNCDNLSDQQEIQEGWKIKLANSPEFIQVYSNPNQGDSDRDGVFDDQERACGLDPRQRDTDLDGLTDWEELNGLRLGVGGNTTPMVSRDPDTNEVVYEIVSYSGPAIFPLVDHAVNVDCNIATGLDGFATNPLSNDTDGDLVDDYAELQLGLNPNDSSDGPSYLDDDGDGVPNMIENEGFLITVNGLEYRVYSNPYDPDSDDDGLPDLLEHMLRSNPSAGLVARCESGACLESGVDTDGDGFGDIDEYANNGAACVTTVVGSVCQRFDSLVSNGWRDFVSRCQAADVCNPASIAQAVTDISAQYGTNLNERDSDFDGLEDWQERTEDFTITVNGVTQVLVAPVSDPLVANTDADEGDTILDGEELFLGVDGFRTNPGSGDTDGDTRLDQIEIQRRLNPTEADKRVSYVISNLTLSGIAASSSQLAWRYRNNGDTVCSIGDEIGVSPGYVWTSETVDIDAQCTLMRRQNVLVDRENTEMVLTFDANEVDGTFDGYGYQCGTLETNCDETSPTQTVVISFDENTLNSNLNVPRVIRVPVTQRVEDVLIIDFDVVITVD